MTIRFIVDVNVGHLARWLRAQGYDTLFLNPADDGELVDLARRDGRVLLTKDAGILDRRPVRTGAARVLLVHGETVAEQLTYIASALGLSSPPAPFSRCLRCNDPLEFVPREAVRGLVPAYVYAHHDAFSRCPSCQRIYWDGTHCTAMRTLLSDVGKSAPKTAVMDVDMEVAPVV
jgi:uncharacterized protein with PIN domain